MERPEWIEVGRIARPHGVRGEVRVTPDTDNPDRFRPGSRLYARKRGDEAPVELGIEYIRGDERFPIIAFSQIGDRDEAEAIKGATLVVPAEDLPPLEDGEFYPWDLVGLQVRLEDGEVLGVVREFLEAPANDVLVVETGNGSRFLLPFVMDAVPDVDIGSGHLVVAPGVVPSELLGEGDGGIEGPGGAGGGDQRGERA